jgi:ABC-type polysaccharide/polyol phosphate export permease
MNDNNKTKTLELIIYVIILVAFVGALFNIPSALTNMVIQLLIGMFVGSFFSLVAGEIVEAFTGDLLKAITLTIEIGDIHFSITAFAIATFIVKVWLFGF